MAILFNLKQIVLLSLGLFFFGSEARDKPSSVGKQFVFSYYATAFAEIYITTRAQGRVGYQMFCKRSCLEHPDIERGEIAFPNSRYIELPRIPAARYSGKHLPVYFLDAMGPILARMILVKNAWSLGSTTLIPVNVAAKDYYFITPNDWGRLCVFSLDYTKTEVRIFYKDNIAYKRDRAPHSDTLPNHGEMREQKECEIKYFPGFPESEKVKPNEWTVVPLQRYESYSLEPNNKNCDMSGIHITSDKPVSVLFGACETANVRGAVNGDIFVESLAPVETYGKLYALPFCTRNKGEVKILATAGGEIAIEINAEVSVVTLSEPSDWIDFPVDSVVGPIFVSSDNPIYVLQTITWTPLSVESGPCMVSIAPVERWATHYFWVNPSKIAAVIFQHYATVMVDSADVDNVMVNKKNPTGSWESRTHSKSGRAFSQICIKVRKGVNEAYIKDRPAQQFLLTVSSFYLCSSYCNAATNVFPKINVPLENCTTTVTEAGDLLDNDCDGRFDEEERNNEDDDGDGKIDEDLQPNVRIHGNWGEWSDFECVAPCGLTDGIRMRKRMCDNPATSGSGDPCIGDGEINDDPPECVHPYVQCSSTCKAKEWGYNCSRTCDTCKYECSTEFGTCDRCVVGFTSAFCNESCPDYCVECGITSKMCTSCRPGLLGPRCDRPCPKTFWGPGCEAKCSSRCGKEDCDAKSGACLQCPGGKWGGNCTDACLDDCARCSMRNGKCDEASIKGYLFIFIFFTAVALAIVYFVFKSGGNRGGRQKDFGDEHPHEYHTEVQGPEYGEEWHQWEEGEWHQSEGGRWYHYHGGPR